jgi:hypothetical protein
MPVILEGTPYAYKYAEEGVPEYPAGTLLVEESGGRAGTVYVVDYQGKLRWFKTGEQFLGLGFKWEDIIKVPESVLIAYGADADNKNVRVISDSDPLLLVAPKTKTVDKTTKLIVFGASILIAVVIYMKIKKGK